MSAFAFATGYWRMPEQTVASWRNLWFHSGDRAVRDPDGSFRFLDRLKDAIRRRGENISAWEVEQVLQSHPDVAAAAVIPVPSELGEDEVHGASSSLRAARGSIRSSSWSTASHASPTSRSRATSTSSTSCR